jgi:hypothetical protein
MRHEPIEQWERRRRRAATVRRDYTGLRSGALVAIKPIARSQFRTIVWLCQCDCGETSQVVGYLIAAGRTRSCGCARQKRARTLAGRHCLNATKESIGRKG